MKRIFLSLTSIVLLFTGALFAQDSVEVTFYYKPNGNPNQVHVPGQFNGWQNTAPISLMTEDTSTGIWYKTIRLKINPNNPEIPNSYQYKFWDNINNWISDPLNPVQNPSDNNNSVITPTSPTIFYLLPNSKSGIIYTQQPLISAYIFPSVKYGVDTSSFVFQIDGASYEVPGTDYNPTTKFLSFISPVPLQNGTQNLKLSVKNTLGNLVADSTSITVQAGAIQILNQGGYVTLKSGITIYGSLQDTSIHNVSVVQNGTDTTSVQASNGSFSLNVSYRPGPNTFVAIAKTATDSTITSTPFTMTYFVNHSSNAVISFSESGNNIILSAQHSTDPDSAQTPKLKFLWGFDTTSASQITGVEGSTSPLIAISRPTIPGEYNFSLVATDSSGYSDTTRSYFTIDSYDSATFPTYASNPEWVKMGRIYELFFNSFTPQKTINAATQKLQYIRNMGFNIIWVMPVMKNNQPMDNSTGTGYNIVDFYTVAPEYGTNADFKNFVDTAHQLGMKVILDVTPNQTSFNHPFVINARQFGKYSFYWDFYVHSIIGNNNGLGSSLTSDGFFYYTAYSDQLLNYNWADPDARAYMDNVYKWWIENMGVDGYRYDSYWGPHNRANNGAGGEDEMGTPTRILLKHFDPDIFLLGETAGTGVGTQVDYADDGGGIDAAYDWNMLHNAVQSFNFSSSSSVNTLNTYVTNYGPNNGSTMGYLPGPNSLFMRCMENHDEDRIAYIYGSYQKTMPMATVIFTVPGIPMMYSGQEVGWGLGISNFDQRRRGVIDWNSPGKALLMPHYEKLAWIRGTFPAFSTQLFNRLSAGNPWVYGYTRPYNDQDGIALENFSDSTVTATFQLTGTGSSANVEFPGGVVNGKTYYMNDVYNDTSDSITFSGGQATYTTTLPPYGSAVYVLSDSIIRMNYPVITSIETGSTTPLPRSYALAQNYPNPFNPSTAISCQLSAMFH